MLSQVLFAQADNNPSVLHPEPEVLTRALCHTDSFITGCSGVREAGLQGVLPEKSMSQVPHGSGSGGSVTQTDCERIALSNDLGGSHAAPCILIAQNGADFRPDFLMRPG